MFAILVIWLYLNQIYLFICYSMVGFLLLNFVVWFFCPLQIHRKPPWDVCLYEYFLNQESQVSLLQGSMWKSFTAVIHKSKSTFISITVGYECRHRAVVALLFGVCHFQALKSLSFCMAMQNYLWEGRSSHLSGWVSSIRFNLIKCIRVL